MGDVGAVAGLIKAIFDWAVDPEGYHALTLGKKLERLQDAGKKAIDAKDWPAVDALIAECRRLQRDIV